MRNYQSVGNKRGRSEITLLPAVERHETQPRWLIHVRRWDKSWNQRLLTARRHVGSFKKNDAWGGDGITALCWMKQMAVIGGDEGGEAHRCLQGGAWWLRSDGQRPCTDKQANWNELVQENSYCQQTNTAIKMQDMDGFPLYMNSFLELQWTK